MAPTIIKITVGVSLLAFFFFFDSPDASVATNKKLSYRGEAARDAVYR